MHMFSDGRIQGAPRLGNPIVAGGPGANYRDKAWHWSLSDDDRIVALALAEEAGITHNEPDIVPYVDSESYAHQLEGIGWLRTQTKALLADEPGLGKTIQALRGATGESITVVAPACMTHTWAKECRVWRPDLEPIVVSGRGSLRGAERGQCVIGSYEALADKVDASTLILDEVHLAKNRKAKRAKRAKAAVNRADQAIGLSGTPMPARPADLIGVLETLGCLQRGLRGFMHAAKALGGRPGPWGGYVYDLPMCTTVPYRLRRVMLRRLKSEVLGLPPIVRSFVGVKTRKNKLPKEIAAHLDKGDLPPFELLSAARAATAKARIPAMFELLEGLGKGVLVFSAHRAPIDALAAQGWETITGDTPVDKRTAIVERFQSGEIPGVGATIGAAGIGLTLTRASTVLFVDRAWNPDQNTQAEDRAHRIGQGKTVHVMVMTSLDPLESRVESLLEDKREASKTALGD